MIANASGVLFHDVTETYQPGDHVRVWRGLYSHHAIYMGNGRLIEFGGGVSGGPVAYVDFADFSRGTRVDVVSRGGIAAVERAQSQLGRADFNLLSRNCEHFATWCTTGQWVSGQVQFAKIAAIFTAIVWATRKKTA